MIPKTGDTDAMSRIATVLRRLTTDIESPHASYVANLADSEFINTLRQFVELYEKLDACELEFGEDSAKINRIVSCIQALPFDDWRGAALLWLSRKPSPRQTLEFFKALDALGLGLLVLGATSQTISKRFARVIEEIVAGKATTFSSGAIFLTDQEKGRIRTRW